MNQPVLLVEPPYTRFDVHFRLFGFPVRISPFFWLMAALLGLRYAESVVASEKLSIFLMFVVCVFLSILVHELGHALLIRRFGWGSRIVLYHLGGLATFESQESYLPTYNQYESNPWVKIIIAFAGPLAGFVLAGVVMLTLWLANTGFALSLDFPDFWNLSEIANFRVANIAHVLLTINIYWGLMNLLPVYPLDGGQIARELFVVGNARKGIERSLLLSAITGFVVGVAALIVYRWDGLFMALLFGVLGYASLRTWRMYRAHFAGGGGGPEDYDAADWWKQS